MTRLLFLLTLASLAVNVLTVNTNIFDCRRTGDQTCDNSKPCDGGTGTCTCGATHAGYKCTSDTGTAGTGCSGCPTGSTCSPTDECECPEGLYQDSGDATKTCKFKRLGHMCSVSGKMIINVNVEGTFKAYVEGQESSCLFDSAGGGNIPTNWQGVSKEIDVPSDTNCGAAVTTTNADSTTKTCVTVIIRYNDDYLTSLDTEATFCCSGATVEDVEIGAVAPTGDLPRGTTVLPPAATSADLDVSLLDSSDAVIVSGTTVDIGNTLKLKIQVAADSDFAALKVIKCDAQDVLSTPTVTVPLLTNSCPASGIVDVTPGAKVYTITTEAIKLVGKPNVFYVCDVLLCTIASECAAPTCTKRRKREVIAPSNSTQTRSFATFVRINDPFADEKVEAAIDQAVTKTTNINLSAAVIGLAVVVLLLLAMCLLLGVCLINRKRQVHDCKQ